MGVNLAHAPVNVDRPATCIADHLRAGELAPPTPVEALSVLSEAFVRYAAAWTRAGFAPLREEWLRGAAGMGQACVARLDRETLEGVAEGLDGDGALLLRLPDRSLRRIAAGDVFFPQVA
jgi:BirA family biotin operon repressor/biotin-[acetyl-CoA-carboxylase] ligase